MGLVVGWILKWWGAGECKKKKKKKNSSLLPCSQEQDKKSRRKPRGWLLFCFRTLLPCFLVSALSHDMHRSHPSPHLIISTRSVCPVDLIL